MYINVRELIRILEEFEYNAKVYIKIGKDYREIGQVIKEDNDIVIIE